MKSKSLIIFFAILLLTGGAAYGIIWFRNRKNAGGGSGSQDLDNNSGTGGASTINTGNQNPVAPLTNTYDWWIKKLGFAGFPLKMNSRGVEVLKLQQELNRLSAGKSWGTIAEDGIWGFNTQTRFKLLFPEMNEVPKTYFAIYFDPQGEILK